MSQRKPRPVTTEPCPCCSHTKGIPEPGHMSLWTCARCNGLHGTCYLGESYGLVLPWFHPGPDPDPKLWRYFDFTCLGSKSITRRHGWYDPATRLVLQVG